jgi:hypothetical protein
MLAYLAAHRQPITHETLDAVSPSPHADYIREILVRTAILEPRNEYLDRLRSERDDLNPQGGSISILCRFADYG